MEWYYILLIVYLIVMNVAAVIVTVKDKKAAKRKSWRIPEKTLFIVAALSGCVTMYITMHLIHHKTKHKRFMIGIPVIFLCEVFTAIAVWGILR